MEREHESKLILLVLVIGCEVLGRAELHIQIQSLQFAAMVFNKAYDWTQNECCE